MFTINAFSQMQSGGAAQEIANELCLQIEAGSLSAGEKLAEEALAKAFNVSRGPVREALRYLATIGLVTFTPNKGAMVRVFSFKEAKALYEYRIALEVEAAHWAAERIDEQGRGRIDRLLQDHTSRMSAQVIEGYITQVNDGDFHSLVAQLSQSSIIIEVLTKNLYPQLVLLRRQHANVRGRGKVALIEHQRIAEAIKQGDGVLASLLMRRHLQFSWETLKSQLNGVDDD